MDRKKKIRRAFILSASVYVIINIFIFGIMNAYVNTNNTVSRDHLVMASVSEINEKTTLKILDRTFELDKDSIFKTAGTAGLYAMMPNKLRVCTDIILNGKNFLKTVDKVKKQ